MTHSDKIIVARGISKKYRLGASVETKLTDVFRNLFHKKPENNDFWALQDISFDVSTGEALGIIGRNGAGKSTILKILSRITEPTKGYFEINGRVSSLLEVGTGFNPELTGRENIFLNGIIMGMTKAEVRKKFDEIVDFSGVEQFIDTPVKRYSSGMYVRLAFSIAAHLEPEILILDEVLSVGDSEFQKKCFGKMNEVTGRGQTVLFVSHNMSAIQQLCSRCILLQKGEIKSMGPTTKVIEEYLSYTGDVQQSKSERIGDQSVTIEDFYLTDVSGNRVGEFFMGDTICLILTLKFNKTMKNVEVGVAVKNIYDEKISHFSNYDDGLTVSGDQGEVMKVMIKIPDVYFTAGLYKIEIGVEKFHDIYDCLFDCISFNLIQGNRVKRGYVIPQEIKTFIPTKWEVLVS